MRWRRGPRGTRRSAPTSADYLPRARVPSGHGTNRQQQIRRPSALAIGHSRSLDDLDGIPPWIIVLNAVGLVLIGISGWLGGKLSYHYGVRVADEATQAQGWES